jgi:hypothetical protein
MKIFQFLLVCLCLFVACKKPERTNWKKLQSAGDLQREDSSQGAGQQVSGQKPVSNDEYPSLTLTVDVVDCMGDGKWYDKARPATPTLGAVSVILNNEEKNSSQPDVKIYQPDPKVEGSKETADQNVFVWRLSPGAYSLTAVALNVATNAVESKIAWPLKIEKGDAKNLIIKGKWTGTKGLCSISVQP